VAGTSGANRRLLEGFARTACDGGEWVVVDRHGETGLVPDQLVEAGHQRSSAHEHQSAVRDVG
jgi:hypothetical protein